MGSLGNIFSRPRQIFCYNQLIGYFYALLYLFVIFKAVSIVVWFLHLRLILLIICDVEIERVIYPF